MIPFASTWVLASLREMIRSSKNEPNRAENVCLGAYQNPPCLTRVTPRPSSEYHWRPQWVLCRRRAQRRAGGRSCTTPAAEGTSPSSTAVLELDGLPHSIVGNLCAESRPGGPAARPAPIVTNRSLPSSGGSTSCDMRCSRRAAPLDSFPALAGHRSASASSMDRRVDLRRQPWAGFCVLTNVRATRLRWFCSGLVDGP